ncbi:FkbM family methyltransferase [Bosea caraganae]|uniref:FkbM family methyltransferase n=1 Tax=Bosea caraganae TaxID=2763117 RepID=A0A370L821_9HYPH|nr:FkbM family methyltransferase [Bosea caraganae]RDJ26310.1 FkbM family methyltransferase [Bosea caraganae]
MAQVEASASGAATGLARVETTAGATAAGLARVEATAGATAAGLARVENYAGQLLRSRAVPLGTEVLCRTSFGWLLVPAEDLRLVSTMVEVGDAFEPGTSLVLQRMLGPGDQAVDVGANIGSLTLVMAASVGTGGKVVAFEPTPRCADLLRRTIALKGAEGAVTIVQCAIGSAEATAKLHLGLTSSHNSLLPLADGEGGIEVPVRTLDSALPDGMHPKLVKVDVEGMELEVLRGMPRLLESTPGLAMIVEFGASHLERLGMDPAGWLGAFAEHGFRPWEISEGDGSIRAIVPSDLDGVFSVNLLMLRRPPSDWPKLVVRT